MVRCGFEVGEPVMAKDYRNRGSVWTKGVIQDRLGPVTYQVEVGKLLWKRHIDQLRELAGSKVADVEPKSSELPEVDLPETPDASMPVPIQDPSPQPQFVLNETPATPLVEVPPSGQIVPQEENRTDTPVPTVPEEPRCRSTRIRLKPKRLIEEMC